MMEQVNQAHFTVSQDVKTTFLKRKLYIQPFETILASAELYGLLNQNDFVDRFQTPAPISINLEGQIDFIRLQKHLAYWERISNGESQPTWQVLFEKTQDSGEGLNKNLLEFDEDDYHSQRRLRYGPHDIHEYRGKFFPQMVRAVLNSLGLNEGSIVLDPMCGSGTTTCEARALGMKALGVDMNPLSVLIAKVKTEVQSYDLDVLESDVNQVLESLGNFKGDPEKLWSEHDFVYLKRWFSIDALQDISSIILTIENVKHPETKDFLCVCLSNILREISWQKKSDLRVRKDVGEYGTNQAYHEFSSEVRRQMKKLRPYIELMKYHPSHQHATIVNGDARQLLDIFPEYIGKCDAIVTSPPYATALPYLDTDRLSLIALNLLPRKEHRKKDLLMIGNREVTEKQRREIWEDYKLKKQSLPSSATEFIDGLAKSNHADGVGFRRRNLPALLAKYFLDMRENLQSALKMMKPNGVAFYVVGNNSTNVNGKRIAIETDHIIWDLASMVGWGQVTLINMELLKSRDIFKKNQGNRETILVLKARE